MRYTSKRQIEYARRRLLLGAALLLLFLLLFVTGKQDVHAAKQNADIVMIGDSYAAGYNPDIKSSHRVSNPWPSIVTQSLGTSQYVLKCRNGAGFCRTLSDGVNFFTLLRDAAATANPQSVQKVIVIGGYNDRFWNYDIVFPRVASFVTKAQDFFPNAEIIIGMGGWHASNSETQHQILHEVTPAYKDGAELSGAAYITGLDEILPNTSKWHASDHFHPNKTGQRLLGNHIASFIKCSTMPLSVNGFSQQSNGYVYLQNGIVESDITRIVYNPWDGKWYFMRNGVFDPSFTGVAKSIENGKWYFVRKGILDWNYTGIAKSIENGKWYLVRKGKVNWKFTGIAKSIANGKWYFVRNGQLDRSFTGVAKSIADGKWYYVRNGVLRWNYTGLARSVENKKLYYVRKGRLDWSYTGSFKGAPDHKLHFIRKGRVIK